MFNRQIGYLSLMIFVPLALLGWLGLRLAQQQESDALERYREVKIERLRDFDQRIQEVLASSERDLNHLLRQASLAPNEIRAASRTNPHVAQVFVLADSGQILYPDPTSPLNASERQFLTSFGDLLVSGDLRSFSETTNQSLQPEPTSQPPPLPQTLSELLPQQRSSSRAPARQRVAPQPSTRRAPNSAELQNDSYQRGNAAPNWESSLNRGSAPPDASTNPTVAQHGWYTWYWGRGLNLIAWNRRPTGEVVGILLERARWMADLVAELPDTGEPSPDKSRTAPVPDRVQLLDSGGHVVYQWGRFEPADTAEAFAELTLSPPLSSWRLKYFMPPDALSSDGRGVYFSVLSSLLVVGIGLVVLAVFVYREQQRHMREASQRVNFVNQVSHELKTPLTNVRMYAELLESDLDELGGEESDDNEPAAAARNRLAVIVTESQRLSRLIGNVLTFARGQRTELSLHPRLASVDEVLERVIDSFRATLVARNIDIDFQADAGAQVQLDSDALEQIIVNLLSNVEKYAGNGGAGRVTINSQRTDDITTIVVGDDGPGLRPSQREKIFQPFYRATDSIEEAAGTGIGLSIARQLARLHGGDLRSLSSATGATFEVRLHTPATGAIRNNHSHNEYPQ